MSRAKLRIELGGSLSDNLDASAHRLQQDVLSNLAAAQENGAFDRLEATIPDMFQVDGWVAWRHRGYSGVASLITRLRK